MADVALSLLVLKSRQIERLRAFYEALGCEFVEERHGKGPLHFSAMVGTTLLEIYPVAEGDADSTTRLGFRVDDLPAVLATLHMRGLSARKEPKGDRWGMRVVVKDPDGRSIELYASTW